MKYCMFLGMALLAVSFDARAAGSCNEETPRPYYQPDVVASLKDPNLRLRGGAIDRLWPPVSGDVDVISGFLLPLSREIGSAKTDMDFHGTSLGVFSQFTALCGAGAAIDSAIRIVDARATDVKTPSFRGELVSGVGAHLRDARKALDDFCGQSWPAKLASESDYRQLIRSYLSSADSALTIVMSHARTLHYYFSCKSYQLTTEIYESVATTYKAMSAAAADADPSAAKTVPGAGGDGGIGAGTSPGKTKL